VKRIPCAFVKDERTGFVTPRPTVDWFAAGLGVAHRKWDGIPYLLDWSREGDGGLVVYRGIRFTKDDPTPIRFIQTSDAGAAETTGWVQVGGADEAVMVGLEGLVANGKPIEAGTYELCGPGIKGNHEGLEYPTLFRHDLISYLRTPRRLDDLIAFMIQLDPPGEGLVWLYGDQLCQLSRRDVGLDWPTE
jgi:hypothetical protein